MQKQRQADCDRNMLFNILNDLRIKIGHTAVINIYKAWREIKNKLFLTSFPVSVLFRLSLTYEMKRKYANKTINEIAKAEGLSQRTVYSYYHQIFKDKTSDLVKYCNENKE